MSQQNISTPRPPSAQLTSISRSTLRFFFFDIRDGVVEGRVVLSSEPEVVVPYQGVVQTFFVVGSKEVGDLLLFMCCCCFFFENLVVLVWSPDALHYSVSFLLC